MLDSVQALIPVYGVALIFAACALGCLGVPAPASVSLVVGGAFVAAGELDIVPVAVAGLLGAAIGDHAGYWAGVRGSGWVERLASGRADSHARARAVVARWGMLAVFLSRWLASPLGAPVNIASGILGMPWRRFAVAVTAGEIIWVALFVGLGYAFSHSLGRIVEVSGTFGLAAAAAVALALAALTLRPLLRLRLARRR